jgi:hypothetical protein
MSIHVLAWAHHRAASFTQVKRGRRFRAVGRQSCRQYSRARLQAGKVGCTGALHGPGAASTGNLPNTLR